MEDQIQADIVSYLRSIGVFAHSVPQTRVQVKVEQSALCN